MGVRFTAALATVLLAMPMAVAAQTGGLTIRTYNYFGASSAELEVAQAEAGTILGQAGVQVTWIDCPVDRDAQMTPARCAQPLEGDVMLRIGTAGQSGGHPYVSMGFSLVNAADGHVPCLSTVYGDVVTSIAHGAGVDMRNLLGRAIAHEIGHVLLGTNQHSASGLMRATWSQSEFRRHKPADWQFLNAEGRTMQAAVLKRAGV